MNEYYSSSDRIPAKSDEMREIDRALDIGVEEFGTTANPFIHQTEALKARIFHGANKVEFEFFGSGKGRKEAATPESFGKRERLDMRELAEFNEIETSTHATVGVSGLSGLDMRQGTFDDHQRKEAIDEIKRAIHFAADATTGGAVVFHTGEAPRSMYSEFKDEKGKPVFTAYPDEDIREQFLFADPVTKKIFPVRANDRIAVPEIKKDRKGNYVYLKDENGKEILDPALKQFDPIHKGRIPIYELDEKGSIKVKVVPFSDWKNVRKKEYEQIGEKAPDIKGLAKDFYRVQALYQVQFDVNYGRLAKGQYEELLEERDKIMKSLNFYREMKKKVPREDWWKFEKQIANDRAEAVGFVPPGTRDPVNFLEKELAEKENRIKQAAEFDILGKRRSLEQMEMIERSQFASNFAVSESSKSMADLGIYAWQKTEQAHKDFKSGKKEFDIKNPIYIAPENLFPEVYGSHPDELKNIVLNGRKEMAKELKVKYGMDEKKAQQLAKEHIKATFDIGHANIWRKFFVSKEGESLESRDKRFNKWLLEKTKKLVDEGIVGHVHISDNFGFHDEHLTAGDGNSPIKEFIKQAKDAGLKEFIVESGSFNPDTSLPDTWRFFDSPVYGVQVSGTPARNAWTDFHRSYFGRTEGPRYIVGEYAPSDDFKGSPFYSGLNLE